jgi:thiamine transport system ATP-binding protein
MSALDARLRERLRREIRRIQTDLGVTTIYVTHDQAEALAVSDRLAVLSAGTVEQIGEPKRLYRRPESRFVADFVGENNVFDGTVVEANGVTATVRTGDRTFDVTTGDSIGGAVTFCVRPGAFDPDAARNRITGRVLDSEFLGETTRVRLDWQDRTLVVSLSEPPDREELTVGFDPTDVWIID